MIVIQRFAFSIFLGLLLTSLPGCGGEDGNSGATASLRWEPVAHHAPVTYTVHYGKQSTGDSGSCSYENSIDVSEPYATITGLEFNTVYYFAVSAYHGHRSFCSNEASKST